MSEFISLLEMRAELLARSMPDANWLAYWRKIGPLDHATVAAGAGALHVTSALYRANRTFDLASEGSGVLSAVVEVFDADGDVVLDLVAWPLHRPDKFAVATGVADALGVGQVMDPASYHGGRPLKIHRTPEAWLRCGCSGVVILNPHSAPRWLSPALGNLGCEDLDHAREVGRHLHPYFSPRRILMPRRIARAA